MTEDALTACNWALHQADAPPASAYTTMDFVRISKLLHIDCKRRVNVQQQHTAYGS